jgi:hypothetical protein
MMPKVKVVESRIKNVEGFEVAVRYHRGGDVRSDKEDFPWYPYENAAKGEATVADWKRTRFEPTYPGYDVEVRDRSGSSVRGNMKLATLRELYDRT